MTARLPRSRRTFVSGAAALGLPAIVKAPARAAQFEFKCGSNLAASHPSAVRAAQMWAGIEQESGGRIHTQFFPGSQLGGDLAMLSQLRLGALHFLLISPASIASAIPPVDISSLGFAFRDADEGFNVTSGPLGAYIQDEMAAKDLHCLRTFWSSGFYQIGSTPHPIRTPVDLRGFKIRVADSKILVGLFKTLGASPTPLDLAEVYPGLQTRLIDGEGASLVAIESSRWFEINKYISLTNHSYTGNWLIANGDAWKSLPPELQETIERNNTRYARVVQSETKAGDAALMDKLRQQGIAFNPVEPAAFRATLRPYYQEWAGTFGSRAWGLLERAVRRKLI